MDRGMTTNGGRLLLLLASSDVQSASQLATSGELGGAATLRQLQQLASEGFVVVTDDEAGLTLYRLTPKGVRLEELGRHQRILVVENDAVLRDIVVKILEHEGYVVIGASKPADAVTLLKHVTFDLVITDGFSGAPGAVFVNSTDVLNSAEATPVVLFTAHRLELDDVQAAGFRDLITKPFGIDTLWRQVRALLDC